MPRGVPQAILDQLNATVINSGFFYLFEVGFRTGKRYWDRRNMSVGGKTYEPRILSITNLAFMAGNNSEVTLELDNTDGLMTQLDQQESWYGVKVVIKQYVPAANQLHVVFVGYLDEPSEISDTHALVAMYADVPGMRTRIPARELSLTCRHEFGKFLRWKSVVEFDGAECPYRRTGSIGFSGTLDEDITASTTTFAASISTAFTVSDQIKIGTEIMLVTGIDGGLTVVRGWRSTTAVSHASGATIFFASCQKTTDACTARGMYGNNPADTFGDRMRNYFGGLPILNGYSYGRFRQTKDQKPVKQRVSFSGNESAYSKTLPLVYGRCRVADPILLLANPEGDFLTGLFVICEGVLATNPDDDDQTDPYLAFLQDAASATIEDTTLYIKSAVVGGSAGVFIDPASYDGLTEITFSFVLSEEITALPLIQIVDRDDHSHIFLTIPPETSGHYLAGKRYSGTFVPNLAPTYYLLIGPVMLQQGTLLLDAPPLVLSGDPDAERYLRMNGQGRHDTTQPFRDNYGIQVSTGPQDQIEPGNVFFPNEETLLTTKFALWGSAWFVIRIDVHDSPVVDTQSGADLTGLAGIAYGRLVRVYQSAAPDDYIFKATNNPAWALMDAMASRRAGAGVSYADFNIQSFIDAADFCDELVTDIVNPTEVVRRWTFNGMLDDAKAFDEWVALICMGMHCTRPFRDADGKYKIKPLTALGDDLASVPLFTDVSGSSRNIIWTGGVTSLVKFRKRRQSEIPNRIKATFVNYFDFGKVDIVIDDEPSQTLTPTRNIVEKNIDLVGCSTLDEAARSATLVLRIGEFAEGGLSNNNGVRFMTFQKGSQDLEVGDVIAVESPVLDPEIEHYFRITNIDDAPQVLPSGALIFLRTIEAMLHVEICYDDTAFTIRPQARVGG